MSEEFSEYQAIVEILKKQEQKDNEQRKKRDLVTVLPVVLSYISATMVFVSWMILEYYGPSAGSQWGWLTFFGQSQQERFRWPKGPVNVVYVLLIISMVQCVVAFICNRMRMKRSGDKYMISVFIIGAIALITFVSFLVKFLPMGILGR